MPLTPGADGLPRRIIEWPREHAALRDAHLIVCVIGHRQKGRAAVHRVDPAQVVLVLARELPDVQERRLVERVDAPARVAFALDIAITAAYPLESVDRIEAEQIRKRPPLEHASVDLPLVTAQLEALGISTGILKAGIKVPVGDTTELELRGILLVRQPLIREKVESEESRARGGEREDRRHQAVRRACDESAALEARRGKQQKSERDQRARGDNDVQWHRESIIILFPACYGDMMPQLSESKWRHHGVRVVHGDELDVNTPQTPGMNRAAAITTARAGAEKLWAGTVVIHPKAKTGAHHHGPVESVIYVVSGRARMRWGDRLEFVAEAGPGDFIYVPPFVPHQEINANDDVPLSCVLVRSGQEPVVVNLDLPNVEANPENVRWVDNIHPDPNAKREC